MASTKKSQQEKQRKNVESATSDSKSSRQLKNTKERTADGNSKRKKDKANQSNKRKKIANGAPNNAPVSSSAESEENTYEPEELAEVNKRKVSNGKAGKAKSKSSERKKINNDEVEDECDEDKDIIRIPINRIRTIVKGQDSESRLSNEAVFAINKATEKFLERFTKDAYASCVEDRKKSLAYKHLASAVSKERRYDFLSDFVPKQVGADDALKERFSRKDANVESNK